jgi:4-carboxymuconolactone decarboxylase
MRVPKLTYEQLTPEQKVVWDEVVAGPRKKMHGPFFVWLHSHELLSRGQQLGLYARFHSGLPQRLSELCILITSARWRASGEWVDHAPIARELGIDAEALEALRKGEPAKFKSDDEQVVYDMAQELLRTHEVSDATYKRAEAVLGMRGVIDIIAVLGYYGWIAMTLKVFKLPPGEGAMDPFADVPRPA